MAPKATIFKAQLEVSDLDKHYYDSHSLTLARHPSETDERLMLRLLAFALFADPQLTFTRGLSSTDEPDLWQQSLSGDIERWIDLGQPEVKRVRKACGRADQVVILTYGGGTADAWWEKNAQELKRCDNLTVLNISSAESKALASLATRSMELSFTLQEGNLWVAAGDQSCELSPQRWLEAQR